MNKRVSGVSLGQHDLPYVPQPGQHLVQAVRVEGDTVLLEALGEFVPYAALTAPITGSQSLENLR